MYTNGPNTNPTTSQSTLVTVRDDNSREIAFPGRETQFPGVLAQDWEKRLRLLSLLKIPSNCSAILYAVNVYCRVTDSSNVPAACVRMWFQPTSRVQSRSGRVVLWTLHTCVTCLRPSLITSSLTGMSKKTGSVLLLVSPNLSSSRYYV